MGAGYPCSGWRRCRPISTCGTRCFPRQCAATSLTNTMPFRIGKPCCIPRTARSRACFPSRRSVWARAACWPCANRAACAGSRPAPSGPGRSTRLTIFRAIPPPLPRHGRRSAPRAATLRSCSRVRKGRSGTARSGHPQRGTPPGGPVAVHCGGIPRSLMRSELFGFDGEGGRPGKCELADGGTLFLDGVEALPDGTDGDRAPAARRETARVGGGQGRTVNVRLIAGAGPGFPKPCAKGFS
ncbi:MAG: sigma 54-interacting transcriptional regulator [Bilophila wadsworthia]